MDPALLCWEFFVVNQPLGHQRVVQKVQKHLNVCIENLRVGQDKLP